MSGNSRFYYINKLFNSIVSNYFIAWIIFISFFARLATWFFPYDSDQWIYYYVGNNWFHHGTLYITAWDHKAPIIYAINGLMSIFFGNNLVVQRLFFTLIAGLTMWVFYITSIRFFKYIKVENVVTASRISTIFFAFWFNLSQFTNSGNDTENFGTIFIILALYTYLLSKHSRTYFYLFLTGISISILAYFKINFLILVLPIILDIIRIHYKDFKKLVLSGLTIITPTILLSLFWYYYFTNLGTFHQFIIAAFTFNQKYFSMGWSETLHNKISFLTVIFIAILFFAPFIYKTILDLKIKGNQSLLASILLLTIFFSLLMSPYYNHYYLIVLPYLCLITGVYYKYVFNSRLLISISIVGLLGSYAISTKQLYNNFYGSDHTAYIELVNAADYVKYNSNPNDKVIFYGYGATFYILSDRLSGSRYISASHPYMDYINNFGFNMTSTYIKDMNISKPKFVVISQSDNYLYSKVEPVEVYFNSNYHLVKNLPGYTILKRN